MVASLVPTWRRWPVLATPAILATLPWWPLPVPSIALIWTGPLAWLAIGFALFAAVCAAVAARPRDSTTVAFSPRSATVTAGLTTLAASLVIAWVLAPRLPGGDEPHYLIITESLIRDGDLRIENNHNRRDYASFFGGTLARPDYIQTGVDGQIYSIHAPGLPVLVLPLYRAFGYRGAQATVLLCVALAGALIWRIGWRATGDTRAAWFAWASIVLCTTFLVQSVTIFPDGPGMLAVAAGVWLFVRLGQTRVATAKVVGVSALLAALPWLHTRFAVLAAALGPLAVWQLLRERDVPLAARWTRILGFAAVPFMSAVGWFGYFWTIYGTPNPAAPYGTSSADTSWTFVPGGVLGLLFDQQFGLLVYAPVLAGSLVAMARCREWAKDRSTMLLGAAAFAYLMAVGSYWMFWAGIPAPPARFITALLPVLVVPQALVWARASAEARLGWGGLLAISLALSAVVLGVDRGELAWNTRDAHARWLDWAGPVVALARGWPSFFWRLTPQVATSEWPFALHVAVAIVIWTTAALGAVAVLRRVRDERLQVPVVTLTFALALMIFIQAGWWLTGVSGLNAARSQVDLLRAAARGASLFEIGAFEVGRVKLTDARLELRPDLSRLAEIANVEWARFDVLPAGSYDVSVFTHRPAHGRLVLRAGRASEPLRTVEIQPLSEQTFNLVLPVDLTGVSFVPDQVLKIVGGEVRLRPHPSKPVVAGAARAAARYQAGDFFFLDDRALLEEGGFWVAGAATTEFVVATDPRARTMDLRLGNGAALNAIAISAGAFTESRTLQPFEASVVTLPVGANGVTRVRLTSPAGFRPSDDGKSRDSRYLGVMVR
jgi:hypothetical protein